YQSSNKGRFPSLNLTHKEVGGSFYTVREIVREIIQENRVLGPGQFSTEEQDNDFITVNYPLGSIASEPQGLLFEKASELYDLSGKEGKESVVLGTESNGKFTKQFDLELVQYSIENSTEEKGQGTDRSSPSENLIISEHSEEASFEASLNGNRKCLNVNELDNVNFGNHVQTNDASEGPSKLLVKAEEESERMGVIQGKDKLTLPTEKQLNNSGNFDGKLNDLEVKKVNISNSTLVLDKASSVGSSSGLVITKGADSSEVPASGNSEGTPDVMIQHAEFNSMVNQHGEVKLTNDSEDNSYSLPINDDTASAYTGVNQLSSHGDSCLETIEQSSLEVSF
ncbi:N-acetyldiaminopimelate deacetylase, partial [Bienertia sinuspersici]